MSLLHESSWMQKDYNGKVQGLDAVERYVTHDLVDRKSVLESIEYSPLTPKYNDGLSVEGVEVDVYLEIHSEWAQIYLDEAGSEWVEENSVNELLEEVTEPEQTRIADWH